MVKSMTSQSSHLMTTLVYSIVKFQLQTHGLTYATMGQDPHEFIIDIGWKNATLKNDRK